MIIVLGSVTVQEARLPEALAQSQAHVARSRLEPGCLSHAVYQDPETPGRLVFVEEWSDQAALARHFEVPASRAFMKSISELATEPPSMSVFNAEQVPI
jgi:quinol monooxygenase YgiN